MRNRFMYVDSLFDAGVVPFVAPAGAVIAQVKLENAPHGVYRVIVGGNIQGTVLVGDIGNLELRKNGQRKYPLTITAAPNGFFFMVLNPNDIVSVNVGPVAGSAAANYVASLGLTLEQELSTDPDEEPDFAAVTANQLERIGSQLEKVVTCLEALKAKLGG